MKNKFFMMRMLALMLTFGVAIIACDNGGGGGGKKLTTVTLLNLNRYILSPIAGEMQTESVETPQYRGRIKWEKPDGSPLPLNEKFAETIKYTAVLTLTAINGYTFDGVSANAFMYSGATVTNATNSGIVTVAFPPTTKETPVTAFDLTGIVTAPKTGASPVTSAAGSQYFATIEWKDSNNAMPVNTFAPSTVYHAIVMLSTKPSYVFENDSITFTYTGATNVTLEVGGTNTVKTVIIIFPATDAENVTPQDTIVTALDLTGLVTAPATGAAPQNDIEGSQYTGSIEWGKEDGSTFTSDFAPITVYKATVTLTALEGYTFNGVGANTFIYTGATSISNEANSGVVTITFPATAIIPAIFMSSTADGSLQATTTKLTLTFDKSIVGLTADDITLSNDAIQKDGLSETATDGVYELPISGFTASENLEVTVVKDGYDISGGPKTAYIYYAIPAAFINLAANGGDQESTTKLTLTFDKDIEGLSADDIELTGVMETAKSGLTKTADKTYELSFTTDRAGDLTVTVAKDGYAITDGSKTVYIYCTTSATFLSFTADGGVRTTTTTKLTLTFDKSINGLTKDDITLSNTAIQKGDLSETATGVYEMPISGLTASEEIEAVVTKANFEFFNGSRSVNVYNVIPAEFVNVEADGGTLVATTKLTLTFDKSIEGLTRDDIVLSARGMSLQKGDLTTTPTAGVYELGFVAGGNGTVSVSAAKDGYNISGGTKEVEVFHAIPATFTELTADGGADIHATTGKLFLTFDKSITNLTADDITFEPGNTGAVKGLLSRLSSGKYELSVTNVSASGTVSVSVAKDGYAIAESSKSVEVYYQERGNDKITVSFADITELAPTIAVPILYRSGDNATDKKISIELSLDNAAQYETIAFKVDNVDLAAVNGIYTLSAADIAVTGGHTLTIAVTKGGSPYSKSVNFTVAN